MGRLATKNTYCPNWGRGRALMDFTLFEKRKRCPNSVRGGGEFVQKKRCIFLGVFSYFELGSMNPVMNSILKVIITCQEDDEEDVLTNEEYDKLKRVIYEAFKHSWKNARTAQTCPCYFSVLLCFFCTRQASTVFFAFCCENCH